MEASEWLMWQACWQARPSVARRKFFKNARLLQNIFCRMGQKNAFSSA
jgi:hypothetical protein